MSNWSLEREQYALKRWSEGASYGVIANELGGDLTRNAVCGKLYRLGAPNRLGTTKHRTERASLNRVKQLKHNKKYAEISKVKDMRARRKKEELIAPDPNPAKITLLDLENHHCKFPLGTPGDPDFHFCGLDRVPGFSYCAFHSAICFDTRGQKRPPLNFVDGKYAWGRKGEAA